jgi:hypothetical protein
MTEKKAKKEAKKKDAAPKSDKVAAAPAKDAPAKDAPAKAEEPTTAIVKLSKQELDEIEKTWASALTELRGRRHTLAGDMLQYRYDVGKIAIDLMNAAKQDPNKRKYGSHTIEEFALQLTESDSSIYDSVKFVNVVDPNLLAHLKKLEWPWSAVQSYVYLKKESNRKKLLEQSEKGKITTREQFRQLVEKLNADEGADDDGQKPPKPKPATSTSALSQTQSFNTLASQMESKGLPGFIEAVKLFKKDSAGMTPAEAEKHTSLIKESKKHIAVIVRLIDSAEKVLADAGV